MIVCVSMAPIGANKELISRIPFLRVAQAHLQKRLLCDVKPTRKGHNMAFSGGLQITGLTFLRKGEAVVVTP